ncbi:autotransporter domain-containing protein [Hyphomicrobium sp. xq]|uniref:Autotransporter domain-containing protein n=1 Tax=Hyphomicrobium album TaxID=2665159 RepID=A0A6I3KRJ1_9HYPH|nr:autotransporter outer membrane beta-barrel domain-containing protein [Hyphomicrobium album]MTD95341.1 autotransporter domain-containing protein [Hyphomicrobium album]
MSGEARASAGCDAVNAGAYNVTNLNANVIGTVQDFSVGDQITFVVNDDGSTAQFQLFGTSQLLAVPVTATPQTVPYTVTGANGDTASILAYFSPDNGSATVTVTATCASAPPPGSSGADASQAVTKGFLLSRINGLLLNSPGAMSLVNRNNSTVQPKMASAANGTTNVAGNVAAFGSAMGLGAGLGNAISGNATGLGASRFDDADRSTIGSNNVQFSGSLSQMRGDAAQARMSKDRMALGAGDGGTLPLAFEGTSPWDIWVEGRYSHFDDDAGNLDRNGHVGVLYVGGDYRVAQNVIVGALMQFDWSKDDSSVLASKVDGNGWMIGPYLSAEVHENVYFDLRASWGRSDNDLTLGTTTGAFDTWRWLVKGALAGNWVHDAWRFTPSAELAYVTESQDAFTNSAGTFVPGQDVSLGRLQFGPEFGYRFAHTAGTFIEPFAAIKGVWDFDNPNVAIIDGFVVGPGDFWGRLEGGLNVMTTSGWLVRGLASWDGVGSDDYNGYTLQGIVNVPLN